MRTVTHDSSYTLNKRQCVQLNQNGSTDCDDFYIIDRELDDPMPEQAWEALAEIADHLASQPAGIPPQICEWFTNAFNESSDMEGFLRALGFSEKP